MGFEKRGLIVRIGRNFMIAALSGLLYSFNIDSRTPSGHG